MSEFVTYNPATGEPLATYPVTDAAEVACAVAEAREAARRWAALSVRERCVALERLRQAVVRDSDALAESVHREIGKPLQEAYAADVLALIKALGWLRQHAPGWLQQRAVPGGPRGSRVQPQAYGVVAVIGTWNYPLFLDGVPIAWALAAGNAVVWKPSELATLSASHLYALCREAGLSVFLVTGDGSTGRALCRAEIDKLAFTGGVTTGRAILKELAARNVPAVMELSGNDAMIVCRDADIETAARSAVWGRVTNAGQSCIAPQRLYVERGVYDRFLALCQQEMAALRPGIDFGPVRTETAREQTLARVREATAQGACLLHGGRPLRDRPGFYVAPTLLAECTDRMRVVSEDFFGPVLPVVPVSDEWEAVEHTNDNAMALAASVWTRDRRHGLAIANRLRVGLVSLNDVLLDAAEPALPFGGLRASGFGKMRGIAGLDEFAHWKVVAPHSVGGARRHLFPYRPQTLGILRAFIALEGATGWRARLDALRQFGQAAKDWGDAKDESKR